MCATDRAQDADAVDDEDLPSAPDTKPKAAAPRSRGGASSRAGKAAPKRKRSRAAQYEESSSDESGSDASEEKATQHFKSLITKAMNTRTTRINDAVHLMARADL